MRGPSGATLMWLICSLFYTSQAYSFPSLVVLNHLPWSPCPKILKSLLCFPAQPLADDNFIYPLKSTGSRDLQHLTCRFLHNLEGPKIKIIQVLSQIHSTDSLRNLAWWSNLIKAVFETVFPRPVIAQERGLAIHKPGDCFLAKWL